MSGTSLLAVVIALFLLPIAVVLIMLVPTTILPRLASTRTYPVISVTEANIRTLLADARAYSDIKGNFHGVKYKDFTVVIVSNMDAVALNDEVFYLLMAQSV